MKTYVQSFDQIGIKDLATVGGKNASLGELTKIGMPVPQGFALTVDFYLEFLNENGLKEYISNQLEELDVDNVGRLQRTGKRIRSKILASEFPPKLKEEIRRNYAHLKGGRAVPVAVRSSATAEDLADASFAGQQDTYLNVIGEQRVLDSAKRCIA